MTTAAVTARRESSAGQKLVLAVEIASTYGTVRRRLRKGTLPEVLATLRSANLRPGTLSTGEALHLGRAVRRTLALLPGDTRCLMQSLVLTALLARRGAVASLVIGVAPGETFGAHAWVEQDGLALLPAYEQGFQRLTEL